MTKKRALLWLIPTILLLLMIPFIVPSALTYAGAEELDLPEYNPVELTNPNPGPQLPLPDARGADLEHYSANPDGYVYDEATDAAWEYRDGTLYVKIENRMIGNTKVFFTWVQIADPTQLRTHVSQETSPIREARKVNPVLAISGDWYSGRSEGIIYRNGVLMRAPKPFGNYDALIIDDQGDFHILYRPAADAFAPYEGHILHSFLFGPALVIDGEMQVFDGNNYGSGAGMGLPNKTQRQAICQMDKLSYLIITTEGPKDTNAKDGGFTAQELAQLAYDMGAVNAYNLDGGNSACLLLNGVKMNRFKKGGVREITDLVYFITAEEPPVPTEAPTEVPTDVPEDIPAETPAVTEEGSTQP